MFAPTYDLTTVGVFIYGCLFGSFINAVIYRVPRGISPLRGRSFCPFCGRGIKIYDMIPLISQLLLRGRCRYCRRVIALRYPLIEAGLGLLAVLCSSVYGLTVQAILVFMVAALLTAVAVIDWETMLIPNSLVLWLLTLAVLSSAVFPEVDLGARLSGLMILSLPMLLLTMAIADCFGGGDIKLMAVCGFLLGWQQVLVAGFLALLLGGGYGAYLLYVRKVDRQAHFAFGPFLVTGIICSLLWGEQILASYLGLLGAR